MATSYPPAQRRNVSSSSAPVLVFHSRVADQAACCRLPYLLINRGLNLVAQTEEALRLRDRAIESSGNGMDRWR